MSYKCNQCDYASAHASYLKTHSKTHCGERSNKCNQCDYASSRKGDLRTHMKKTWMKLHNLFTHSCRGRGSSGNARKKTFFSYGGVSLCCFWEGGVPPQPPSPDRDRSTITTMCIFRWVRESQSRSFLRPALPHFWSFVGAKCHSARIQKFTFCHFCHSWGQNVCFWKEKKFHSKSS